MSTKRQIAANRRNARKSTGPKTAAGKDRAKGNALKHGLTAAQITVFDERPEDFERFYSGLLAALIPSGALEEQLVERIAVCAWRLRRVYRIEAHLFSTPASGEPTVKAERHVPPPEEKDIWEQFSIEELDQVYNFNEKLVRLREEKAKALEIKRQDFGVPTTSIGAVFWNLAVSQVPFVQLSRHETTIERSYHRALHDLERLQARRKGEAVIAPVAVDVSSED
jgi:hypothetical protein